MPFFGFLKPNIESLMRKGDVNSLIKLLESGDPASRKKAVVALTSFLCLKEKPETLEDVKKILGQYAKSFQYEQKGDFVLIKIFYSPTRMKGLSNKEYGEIHSRIERTFKEVGGTKPYNVWPLCVPLYKPSNALLQEGNRTYLSIDEKEAIAVALGKFGGDLAVKPLQDYASISPLTAIQAITNIGSENAITALRSILYNYFQTHLGWWTRSFDPVDRSERQYQSYEERETISALEEALTSYGDYEGCKEIIRAYHHHPSNDYESKRLILKTLKFVIGKNDIRKDRELLKILLKCLGAFPANSGTWINNYYEHEMDDYGNSSITEKKLIADQIGRYDDSKVIVSDIITLEQFKEYMRNLDPDLLRDEEVLNYLVTLIAEYPDILEKNPIAIGLQRVDSKTRISFLNRYMAQCEEWRASKGGYIWSPSKEKGRPNVLDVIGSLKHWLSEWEK